MPSLSVGSVTGEGAHTGCQCWVMILPSSSWSEVGESSADVLSEVMLCLDDGRMILRDARGCSRLLVDKLGVRVGMTS